MTEENAITKFADKPQELLKEIERTGDFDLGFDGINYLVEINRKVDGILDIILPGMEQLWEKQPPKDYEGMTFYEATVRRTQLHPDTIKRHTRVGRMLEAAPDDVRPAIENMGFKSKIQIANTLEDGYELKKEDWNNLANAYYPQEVTIELHEIKGTQPRSQFCQFQEDADGVVWAYTSKGRFVYYRPEVYENEETAEIMAWVHEKAKRKLGVTPK